MRLIHTKCILTWHVKRGRNYPTVYNTRLGQHSSGRGQGYAYRWDLPPIDIERLGQKASSDRDRPYAEAAGARIGESDPRGNRQACWKSTRRA